MSVCYECCVWSGRGLCIGQITHPVEFTECGVSECDREASMMRRAWPTRGCCAMGGERKKERNKVGGGGGQNWDLYSRN
jgi:hypothetical protein